MFNLFERLSAWLRAGEGGGCRAFYGILVSCATVVVFCVLAGTVGIWKAFLFAGLAFVAFAVGDCLAPESWRAGWRDSGAAGTEPDAAGAPQAACRFGLAVAAIDALPTFAYASRGGAEGGGDLESGSGGELCSVCLEDLQAGEMVRQLPTCKHLFHVECIDMWLHSHRTCPMCRFDLSPPREVTAKVAAVETEPPPADDALPPV